MLKSCLNAYLRDHGIIEKNTLLPPRNYMIYDNGDGPKIKWLNKEIPEPTKKQLESYSAENLERTEKLREVEEDIEFLEDNKVFKLLIKLGIVDEKWRDKLRK